MTLNPDTSNNVEASATLAGASRLLPDPPGVQLQRARQIKLLDLVAVADELNLSPAVLKALEGDDYERLPGATFVRGYIRSYARLLKLSGDDLVRCYDRVVKGRVVDLQPKLQSEMQSDVQSSDKQTAKTTGGKKGWSYVAIVVVGAIGIAVGFQYTSVSTNNSDVATIIPVKEAVKGDVIGESVEEVAISETAITESALEDPDVANETDVVATGTEQGSAILGDIEQASDSAVVGSAAVDPIVVENRNESVSIEPNMAESNPAEAISAESTYIDTTNLEVDYSADETALEASPADIEQQRIVDIGMVNVEPAVAIEAEVTPDVASEIASEINLETSRVETPVLSSLKMIFSGDCWVEVRDATGKRVYADLRRAGQVVTLEAEAPIAVKLGNGRVVVMEFNGDSVQFTSSKRSGVANVSLSPKTVVD